MDTRSALTDACLRIKCMIIYVALVTWLGCPRSVLTSWSRTLSNSAIPMADKEKKGIFGCVFRDLVFYEDSDSAVPAWQR